MGNSGQVNERDFMNKLSNDPRIFAINQDLNGKIASIRYNNQTIPDSLERINANVLNFTGEKLANTFFSNQSGGELDFSNVDIAILDTGISLNHPDLNVYRNVSFVDTAITGDDDLGHGYFPAAHCVCRSSLPTFLFRLILSAGLSHELCVRIRRVHRATCTQKGSHERLSRLECE